jgi:hypothetical protein
MIQIAALRSRLEKSAAAEPAAKLKGFRRRYTHLGTKELNRAPHLRPKQSSLIYDNKDVLAADHMPIAPLPIPVAVPIRVPVGVIPIGIGVDSRAIVCMHSSPIGPAGMISAIGRMNCRAAFGMDRSAITSLDCCAITIMSCFPVFSFVSFRVKSGG